MSSPAASVCIVHTGPGVACRVGAGDSFLARPRRAAKPRVCRVCGDVAFATDRWHDGSPKPHATSSRRRPGTPRSGQHPPCTTACAASTTSAMCSGDRRCDYVARSVAHTRQRVRQRGSRVDGGCSRPIARVVMGGGGTRADGTPGTGTPRCRRVRDAACPGRSDRPRTRVAAWTCRRRPWGGPR